MDRKQLTDLVTGPVDLKYWPRPPLLSEGGAAPLMIVESFDTNGDALDRAAYLYRTTGIHMPWIALAEPPHTETYSIPDVMSECRRRQALGDPAKDDISA